MRPIVLILLAINAGVFVLWQVLGESPFMLDNFLVSWSGLAAGRYWTVLTSAFSHFEILHFLINMYVLASFGPVVEQAIGAGRLLGFYLVAAVVSSLSHATVSAFVLGQPDLPALGASGAISGVIVLFSFLFPRARIFLFGLIPLPAMVGVLAFVGLDVVGLIAQSEGGGLPIGHGAHLGGAATGLLYYLLVIRRMQVRRTDPFDVGEMANWRTGRRSDEGPE